MKNDTLSLISARKNIPWFETDINKKISPIFFQFYLKATNYYVPIQQVLDYQDD